MANTVWHRQCCSVEPLLELPQQCLKEWVCTNALRNQPASSPWLNILPGSALALSCTRVQHTAPSCILHTAFQGLITISSWNHFNHRREGVDICLTSARWQVACELGTCSTDRNIHLKVQGVVTVAGPCCRAGLSLGHWAEFPLICFLAARTQLHSLGDIPQTAETSCHQEVCLRFGLCLLFSLCCIHIDNPVSYSQPQQAYLTLSFFDCSNYLTVLLLCSALVHFCQYILHNEVLRSEDTVLHVLTWELHIEKTDSLSPPGNSTYTKKGLRKGSMVIKVCVWILRGKRWESRESCDGHLLLVEILKSHSPLLWSFRPPGSRNIYSPHHKWQSTPILYPKWWLHPQVFGGFYGPQPLQTYSALILNLVQHFWAKTLSF